MLTCRNLGIELDLALGSGLEQLGSGLGLGLEFGLELGLRLGLHLRLGLGLGLRLGLRWSAATCLTTLSERARICQQEESSGQVNQGFRLGLGLGLGGGGGAFRAG